MLFFLISVVQSSWAETGKWWMQTRQGPSWVLCSLGLVVAAGTCRDFVGGLEETRTWFVGDSESFRIILNYSEATHETRILPHEQISDQKTNGMTYIVNAALRLPVNDESLTCCDLLLLRHDLRSLLGGSKSVRTSAFWADMDPWIQEDPGNIWKVEILVKFHQRSTEVAESLAVSKAEGAAGDVVKARTSGTWNSSSDMEHMIISNRITQANSWQGSLLIFDTRVIACKCHPIKSWFLNP